MNEMVKSYLETALWSSTNDKGTPLDEKHSVENISEEAKNQAIKDCDLFMKKAAELIEGLDLSMVGHDFWLTRNGHGAGFWDGDYEESIGNKLTEISKEFKEINAYVQNDIIHFE